MRSSFRFFIFLLVVCFVVFLNNPLRCNWGKPQDNLFEMHNVWVVKILLTMKMFFLGFSRRKVFVLWENKNSLSFRYFHLVPNIWLWCDTLNHSALVLIICSHMNNILIEFKWYYEALHTLILMSDKLKYFVKHFFKGTFWDFFFTFNCIVRHVLILASIVVTIILVIISSNLDFWLTFRLLLSGTYIHTLSESRGESYMNLALLKCHQISDICVVEFLALILWLINGVKRVRFINICTIIFFC